MYLYYIEAIFNKNQEVVFFSICHAKNLPNFSQNFREFLIELAFENSRHSKRLRDFVLAQTSSISRLALMLAFFRLCKPKNSIFRVIEEKLYFDLSHTHDSLE
jgi:hypothetical protein